MLELSFVQSYTDPDVWMRDAGDVYEYVVMYVDDLLAIMKDLQSFFDVLKSNTHNYKLKNIGLPKYHLGANYNHDTDGILFMGAQTYVKCLLKNLELLYG